MPPKKKGVSAASPAPPEKKDSFEMPQTPEEWVKFFTQTVVQQGVHLTWESTPLVSLRFVFYCPRFLNTLMLVAFHKPKAVSREAVLGALGEAILDRGSPDEERFAKVLELLQTEYDSRASDRDEARLKEYPDEAERAMHEVEEEAPLEFPEYMPDKMRELLNSPLLLDDLANGRVEPAAEKELYGPGGQPRHNVEPTAEDAEHMRIKQEYEEEDSEQNRYIEHLKNMWPRFRGYREERQSGDDDCMLMSYSDLRRNVQSTIFNTNGTVARSDHCAHQKRAAEENAFASLADSVDHNPSAQNRIIPCTGVPKFELRIMYKKNGGATGWGSGIIKLAVRYRGKDHFVWNLMLTRQKKQADAESGESAGAEGKRYHDEFDAESLELLWYSQSSDIFDETIGRIASDFDEGRGIPVGLCVKGADQQWVVLGPVRRFAIREGSRLLIEPGETVVASGGGKFHKDDGNGRPACAMAKKAEKSKNKAPWSRKTYGGVDDERFQEAKASKDKKTIGAAMKHVDEAAHGKAALPLRMACAACCFRTPTALIELYPDTQGPAHLAFNHHGGVSWQQQQEAQAQQEAQEEAKKEAKGVEEVQVKREHVEPAEQQVQQDEPMGVEAETQAPAAAPKKKARGKKAREEEPPVLKKPEPPSTNKKRSPTTRSMQQAADDEEEGDHRPLKEARTRAKMVRGTVEGHEPPAACAAGAAAAGGAAPTPQTTPAETAAASGRQSGGEEQGAGGGFAAAMQGVSDAIGQVFIKTEPMW